VELWSRRYPSQVPDEPPAPPPRGLPPSEGAAGPRPPLLRITTSSVVAGLALVVGAALVLRVVAAASTPLIWYLGGSVGAALLYPLVTGLQRVMPRGLAVAVVAVGTVLVAGLVGYQVVEELQVQAERFAEEAPRAAREIERSDTFGEAAREFGLSDKVAALARDVQTFGRFEDPLDAARTAATKGASGFAVWTLGLLMVAAGPRFVTAALHQIPDEDRRARAADVLTTAYRRAWHYLAAMVARGLVLGVVVGAFAAAFGLPTPALLGTWVAAWSLVPGLGLVFGGMPVVLVAVLASPLVALAAFVGLLGAQVLDALVLQRRLEERTLHVGPAVTIIASLVGLALYGPGGLVIALSLAVFGVALVAEVTPPNEPPQSDDAAKVSQSSGSPLS
jgi:putative heme transporter